MRGRRQPGAAAGRGARVPPHRHRANPPPRLRRLRHRGDRGPLGHVSTANGARGRYRDGMNSIRVLIAEDQGMIARPSPPCSRRGRHRGRGPGRPRGRGDGGRPPLPSGHRAPGHRNAGPRRPGRGRRAQAGVPEDEDGDPHHVRPPRLPAPGDGRGRAGFLVKDGPVESSPTIRQVLGGERSSTRSWPPPRWPGASPLTARERDALAPRGTGRRSPRSRAGLFRSEGTVRNYLPAASISAPPATAPRRAASPRSTVCSELRLGSRYRPAR